MSEAEKEKPVYRKAQLPAEIVELLLEFAALARKEKAEASRKGEGQDDKSSGEVVEQ